MTNFSPIFEILSHDKLDAVLISTAAHIRYLISYFGFSLSDRDGFLLLTKDKAYLFTNPLISYELMSHLKKVEIIEHNATRSFAQNLNNVVKKRHLDKIGFESDNLTVTEYLTITENIESRLVSVNLSQLRLRKTSTEIASIKKACDITKKAIASLEKKLSPGLTEVEVAFLFEDIVRKMGATLSFPTIVAFGKNAAIPHHVSDQTKLKSNDLVLIDGGVKYNNYCSDMSRTFFVGKVSKEQQHVYDVVLAAQKMAAGLISELLSKQKPIAASEIDDVAREYIVSQGYPSIPHSLGHGIGIEVHEAPKLAPHSKNILGEGMVFSLEPGIYLPKKFGVRIEDLYAIQEKKLIKLT
ncbi:MAG TPA: aminopeptidase P family protein [Patescibacteria group bacterium]|nr:aminopeptidase P family protein [Patescibacteria group bacterium]